eukprot:9124132-Pyramimonas_sp.AAC.1
MCARSFFRWGGVACLTPSDMRNVTHANGTLDYGVSLDYTEVNRGLAAMPAGWTNKLYYDNEQ